MKQINLFNNNQSVFRPNDSCMNQLISVTRSIFSSFEANLSLEVRCVFLDLSKALDRVWYNDLLYKLQNNGIYDNLLSLIKSFLHNRHQRVVLNVQSLIWKHMTAGVPQGSVLGSCFFLVFINYLPQALKSNSLLTILPYSLLLIMWIILLQQSIMIWRSYKIGYTIGKRFSTLTKINKHKRFYSLEKPKQLFFSHSSLTNSNLNLPHSRNTLDCI